LKSMLLSLTAISLCCLTASGFQAPANEYRQPPTRSAGTTDDSQQKKTKPYIIRVIDIDSKSPIAKAKVTVELENDAKTAWTGLTDSNGVFQFKWDAITPRIKAHTSVEARGFASLDDFQPLIEDRIIGLSKVPNPTTKGVTR
jgi:hypothetical protein